MRGNLPHFFFEPVLQQAQLYWPENLNLGLDSPTVVCFMIGASSKTHRCEETDMLKIGDFSRLSRISIRMLRHYDEIGLLRPQTVDPFTGYRYYSEAQLPLAGRIRTLKELGFGLAAIHGLLEQYENAAQMEQFLLCKREELARQQQMLQERLQKLDSAIKWLRKDGTMTEYDVSLKMLPERYAASVRQEIPCYAQEHILWRRLLEETAPLHIQQPAPGCAMAIFHDGEYKEADVDVEVQLSVTGCYPDTEHVRFKTMPPVQVASATYKGSYEQITAASNAVANWIADNGYEMDGVSFCIYHVGPHTTQNPDDYVTEVCYPVRRKGGCF